MQMSKEEIEIFMQNASDLSLLTTLTYLHKFLDEVLKLEVKVDEKSVRKLTAEEMLAALRDFLLTVINDMKKDSKLK